MEHQSGDSVICKGVCCLKWFNESKGFGFLVPQESDDESVLNRDAFVHVSAFQDKGITALGQDARLKCAISTSEKGLLIDEVLELVDEGDMDAHKVKIPLPPEAGEAYNLHGKVKWYRTDKGYGFVAGEDGKKDIFVHQTALRRNGISDEDFVKGADVEMSVRDVDQGREAVEITLLSKADQVEDPVPVNEPEQDRAASSPFCNDQEIQYPDNAIAAAADNDTSL